MAQPTPFKQVLDIIYTDGCSPRIRKHIQTLENLISQIDPNKKEEIIADGCLTYLARNNFIPDDLLRDLLRLLINKGANKNYRDNTGNILHRFIRANRYELFTEYVNEGVDINAYTKHGTNSIGSTPLHIAVEENKPEFVKYLLACETIKPSLKDREDRTAQDLISKQTDETIKQAFKEWENKQKWQKQPEQQQTIQRYGVFSASNATSSSREYPVSKTLIKRRQLQGYQLVPQNNEAKPGENENNKQSGWLNNLITKLVS